MSQVLIAVAALLSAATAKAGIVFTVFVCLSVCVCMSVCLSACLHLSVSTKRKVFLETCLAVCTNVSDSDNFDSLFR